MIKLPDSNPVSHGPTLPHWVVPTPPRFPSQAPSGNTGRTHNDQRSWEKIVKHPLFAALKHFPKDVIHNFQTQVGGNWNDSTLDPNTRANIAANAERVLIYIDSLGGAHSKANNNKIDGNVIGPRHPLPENFRKPDSDVALFSEAWRLLDFAKGGYSALVAPPLPAL